MDSGYMAYVVVKIFTTILWFFAGWFGIYAILGPWLKARLLRAPRRYPLYLVHVGISLSMANPILVNSISWKIDTPPTLAGEFLFYGFWFAYMVLLTALLEILIIRIFARRRKCHDWTTPFGRWAWITLALNTLAFMIGVGSSITYRMLS